MNPVLDEILMHYGVKRRSGRYPWGSGQEPYQRSGDFLSRIEELQNQGLSEKDISEAIGLSTTDLRLQIRVAKHERRNLEADRAKSLRSDGKSLQEIADLMGYANDSSIRSLLSEDTASRKNKANTTAEYLKKEIEEKGMLDVGAGTERILGISQNTLKESLFILEAAGYNVYGVGIPQATNPGKQYNTAVLCTKDVEYKDVYQKMGQIKMVGEYFSPDSGETFEKREVPASLSSDRVFVRYGDQGGTAKDGVIELRRGVKDLDLGNSRYAQVRILVDDDRYLKGMAICSDDIPDGYDVVFNTNKKSDKSKRDVMKEITNDPDNPFGAYIKANGQSYYIDANGEKKLSVINKLKEEGDWDSMSKNLSSQFLSKQPLKLIKQQLNLTYADSEAILDEIMSYTNPTIKKKLLLEFANECDGAVVTLKAAALPGQKTQVILPLTNIPENEVYARNFENGQEVVLIRYPHGGTFEIPRLVVNNKNPSGRSILGDVTDAVGINPKVAEMLSGADFDGDQVVVIPISNKSSIKSTPGLKALKGFDPKEEYAIPEGNPNKVTIMTKSNTQKQMGMISNLITDMTLRGAEEGELARAVKHSMVVIDAAKHKLNYKQSEKDNGIMELKKAYQGYINDEGKYVSGASTLLSRRKQNVQVPERQGSGWIDPETGALVFKSSGRTYKDPKTGKEVEATTSIKLLNYVDDVRTLSSGTVRENAYADYANKMKALANKARKEYLVTGNLVYDSNAYKTYSEEVNSLQTKLNVAMMNAPRERISNAIANSKVKAKVQENPDMDKKEIKKATQQAIYDARNTTGASGKRTRIAITDKEWEAIQAGGITDSKLSEILRYTDMDELKQRALPRATTQVSTAKVNKINAMLNSGYTIAEISKSIGISTSLVSQYSKATKAKGEG